MDYFQVRQDNSDIHVHVSIILAAHLPSAA